MNDLAMEAMMREHPNRDLRKTPPEKPAAISKDGRWMRKDMIHLVMKEFGLSMQDMRARRRTMKIAFPRQLAMFLCRKFTTASYPKIGQAFGDMDHTTVLYAVDKFESIAREKSINGGDDPAQWARAFHAIAPVSKSRYRPRPRKASA